MIATDDGITIKETVDIVAYIGKHMYLKKSGMNWFGLCPFHKEKTASFSVSREKKMFFCFGCRATGDVIDFTMKYHGLNFKDALERLKREAGLE